MANFNSISPKDQTLQGLDTFAKNVKALVQGFDMQKDPKVMKDLVEAVIAQNDALHESLNDLIRQQLDAKCVQNLTTEVERKDERIHAFGRALGEMEAKLYAVSHPVTPEYLNNASMQKAKDDIDLPPRPAPNVQEVLVLAERLGVMSHAPAYHMKMGLSGYATTKPPGPQPGRVGGSNIDVSRLHRTVDELFEACSDASSVLQFIQTPMTEPLLATVHPLLYASDEIKQQHAKQLEDHKSAATTSGGQVMEAILTQEVPDDWDEDDDDDLAGLY